MLIVSKLLAKAANLTGITALIGCLTFGVWGTTPAHTQTAQLGVKTGLPAASNNVLTSISATSQQIDIFSPTCPTATGPSVAQLFASNTQGFPQALNYNGNATCAVQVTGGSGGYYLIGNEPDDSYSDDVSPSTYATVLHNWVQAIQALDANAHFIGPNLTGWTADTTNPNAWPYGPPTQWFASMVYAYEQSYGVKPPFTALSVHLYLTPDMYTDEMDFPQPYLQIVRQFSAAAVSYGYPAQIWMTEGMVMFPQLATTVLTTTQQANVTAYMEGLLTDPLVTRAYYFQSWPNVQGWQNGSESGRNPFPENAGGVAQTPPTEVGNALLAAVTGSSGNRPTSTTTVSCSPSPVAAGTRSLAEGPAPAPMNTAT